jgi:hypothetical protein
MIWTKTVTKFRTNQPCPFGGTFADINFSVILSFLDLWLKKTD